MLKPPVELMMIGLLLISTTRDVKNDHFRDCLPAGIELDQVVSSPLPKLAASAGKRLTIRETLLRIKARCRRGKLFDGGGKEIYFYRLTGCWGNPPADYQEQLKRQERELQRLRKKYIVVQISCSQTINPRLIH